MKSLLAGLLVMHGLLHLLGVVKAFGLAPLPQLSQAISRPIGLLWLLACLLSLSTAVLLLSDRSAWWWVALATVTLSQLVIGLSWRDARFGSLVNLMLLLGAGLAWAQANFTTTAEAFDTRLLSQARSEVKPVQASELKALPAPVQVWLRRSGCVDRPRVQALRLSQTGYMRTSPDAAWMPVSARQVFSVEAPGFSWFARVEALPGIELLGHDRYAEGHGAMLIKALGLIPVADAEGAAIDQGAMLRFLAEIVWFPSAALAPYISWEAIDAGSARARIRYGGQDATARFNFSQNGDPSRIEARRYIDRPSGATLENWQIDLAPESFRDVDGLRIPTAAQVSWQLAAGEFTWFKLRITGIDYLVPRVQQTPAL